MSCWKWNRRCDRERVVTCHWLRAACRQAEFFPQQFAQSSSLPPSLTCLRSYYEKSIKRWSHLQPASPATGARGDGAKDLIILPEIWRVARRRRRPPVPKNYELNHFITVDMVQMRQTFFSWIWLKIIWINQIPTFQHFGVMWAMVRGNCNLLRLNISADTTFPNNLARARPLYQMAPY